MTFIITTAWFIVGLYHLWRDETEYLDICEKNWESIRPSYIRVPFISCIVALFFGGIFFLCDCFKHGLKILNYKKYTLKGVLKTR